MSSLLLGKSHEMKYDEICEIPLVQATSTYTPVSHCKFIDAVIDSVTDSGMHPMGLRCGVQDTTVKGDLIPGGKMFGLLDIDNGMNPQGDDLKLSVGFRNSYDKSMSAGIVIGSSVMVCDNMMLTGELFAARRHTLNVWNDIIPMIMAVLSVATRQHEIDQQMRVGFKEIGIGESEGLDMLGKMAAHGFLSYAGGGGSAFATAIKEWQEPSYSEFEDRNIWSLYNACTYGTKKSTISNIVMDNAKATMFFRNTVMPELTVQSKSLSEEIQETRLQFAV